MTLQQFIDAKRSSANVNADIRARWDSRIVPNGYFGAKGADEYIARYGNNIGVPKLCAFAKLAEEKGEDSMATRFWEVAFSKNGGAALPVTLVVPQTPALSTIAGLPADLQPKIVRISKDTKSKQSAKLRAADPGTTGFEMRAGKRFMILSGGGQTVYSPALTDEEQARYGSILAEAINCTSLIQGSIAVEVIASWISSLDGRLYETLPQTTDSGKTQITIYPALVAAALDLRSEPFLNRLAETANLAAYLEAGLAQFSEDGNVTCVFTPATTDAAKANLRERPERVFGEGEVWFDAEGKRTTTRPA